ncbi:MAG: WYL domain-containing protein [Candidatus Accumulibacter sp.]|nr:WYL domain-containing protein [Accumulibacter sp.]
MPTNRPSPSNNERLASRLAGILQKLNFGEALDVAGLAEEFGTHPRTIQRDLRQRFAFLPIEKGNDGKYKLEPEFLGQLNFRDIERFAALAGLNGLFPALDDVFFRELFDHRTAQTLSIHGPGYEEPSPPENEFRLLQRAIRERRYLAFTYRKASETKRVEVAPYRLINHDGIWYLAASDAGRPKTYAIGRIDTLSLRDAAFTPDEKILDMLDKEDSIWLSEEKTAVELRVGPPAAPYFKRQKLIARQEIVGETPDGGLIVTGWFAHPKQILPIVRYWIPHVRLVSPENWRKELEASLRDYLDT